MSSQWNKFSWFGRENSRKKTSNAGALSQLEAIAIAITNPLFNKKGGSYRISNKKGRGYRNAKQVFQVPHDEAEGDMYTKITRIERELIKKKKNGNTPTTD